MLAILRQSWACSVLDKYCYFNDKQKRLSEKELIPTVKQLESWVFLSICIYRSIHFFKIFLFYLTFLKSKAKKIIHFSPIVCIKFPMLHFFLLLSAPSQPSHSFMAEHNSLTFPNKKHTLQLNSRGHPHARVTGQARSLTFFRGSLLLTGWDMTFFLFIERKPPQMFTNTSFFFSFHSLPLLLPNIHT